MWRRRGGGEGSGGEPEDGSRGRKEGEGQRGRRGKARLSSVGGVGELSGSGTLILPMRSSRVRASCKLVARSWATPRKEEPTQSNCDSARRCIQSPGEELTELVTRTALRFNSTRTVGRGNGLQFGRTNSEVIVTPVKRPLASETHLLTLSSPLLEKKPSSQRRSVRDLPTALSYVRSPQRDVRLR